MLTREFRTVSRAAEGFPGKGLSVRAAELHDQAERVDEGLMEGLMKGIYGKVWVLEDAVRSRMAAAL